MMFHLRNIFFVFAVFIFFCSSCQRAEESVSYYKKELEQIKKNPEYANVMRSFEDTLNAWLARDIKAVKFLKRKNRQIDDAVFFNKDESKCLVLLADVDPDTSAIFDHVIIMGAEKIERKWQFYFQSYPCVTFDRRELVPKRPFTHKEMVRYVIEDIVSDGYVVSEGILFKKYKINYSYIDSNIWFADWMRKMHYDVFLQSKW